MSNEKRAKKLDPRVEQLLLLILEARRARLAREALQADDLEGTRRVRIQLDRVIEVATAPAPQRAALSARSSAARRN